jgi:hypothetical protein
MLCLIRDQDGALHALSMEKLQELKSRVNLITSDM